jgi:two-component system, LytTR family, sensor histidine kinase AlgZ
VLRAVLFVHAVLAIGVLFGAKSFEQWLTQLALASGVALPGVLSWLVLSCLAKDTLARLHEAAQWTVAAGLGAACAAGWWELQVGLGLGASAPGNAFAPSRWLAPALSGAALAVALFYWLRLRAIAQGPADTSARLAELQSRIRPHFLFNTLNTAITLARVDPARTEGLLEDLAELFRVALTDTEQAVTLGAEVELAQRYLAIEQIRFGERLRVSWDLDPGAAAARVPPLLLQPLVENAVRHGVEPAPEGGAIRVRTRLKRGHAVIDIDNTVPGVASRPGAGMALRNVRERLHLMHDVAAQFEARPDGGAFRVRIVVPM